MATLTSAAAKQNLIVKRSNAMARAMLTRKVNHLLARMGQALNTGAMAISK